MVFLNEEFVPLEQAQISVMDRGFLFGDGVYEVLPAFGGQPFRLSQHLKRLHDSLQAVRIELPYTQVKWEAILDKLINSIPSQTDASIYIQVTRGIGAYRDHTIPKDITPTVFVMATPIPINSAKTTYNQDTLGIKAITRQDYRWERCDIKAITLLPNVLLRQEAFDIEAQEAILIRNGYAVEGAASNLFIFKEGTIITPPKSHYLLPGITRDLILELAVAHDLPHKITPILESELFQAEEVWLTSSVREIMPVIQIDNQFISNGQIGTKWQQINNLYQSFKSHIRNTAGQSK